MSLIVTGGLGSLGDGTASALLVTEGYGNAGPATMLACKAFVCFGAAPGLNYLELTLNNLPTLQGPAADPTQYLLTPLDGGDPATVTGFQIAANRLRILTNNVSDGKQYRLDMPSPDIGLFDQFDNPFQGPFSYTYTASGTPFIIMLSRSVDARTVDIIFSKGATTPDVLNPAKYSISPTLAVTAVQQMGVAWYRLTTSHQTIGTTYTVTFPV